MGNSSLQLIQCVEIFFKENVKKVRMKTFLFLVHAQIFD